MMSLRRHPNVLGALALLLVIVIAGTTAQSEYRLMSQILIFGLFAASLNLVLGYTGMPSLGHALYLGVGAYTTGIMIRDHSENFWLILILGVILSSAAAAVAGLFALRTRGAYFIMITFAFGQLGVVFAEKARSLTGGADGIAGIFRPTFPVLGTRLDDERNFYVFVACFVLLLLALIAVIVRSPFGTTLVGIRENPERMQALGFNVWAHRYAAFVISGAFAGVAGVLLAYLNGFVSSDTMNLTTSAEVLVIVVLGGAGTLLGPLVGAAVILTIHEVTKPYGSHWQAILGLVYILTVFVDRQGLVPRIGSLIAKRVGASTGDASAEAVAKHDAGSADTERDAR